MAHIRQLDIGRCGIHKTVRYTHIPCGTYKTVRYTHVRQSFQTKNLKRALLARQRPEDDDTMSVMSDMTMDSKMDEPAVELSEKEKEKVRSLSHTHTHTHTPYVSLFHTHTHTHTHTHSLSFSLSHTHTHTVF